MKKMLFLLAVLCACLLMTGGARADVDINSVNFPDPLFCSYVTRFDLNGDGRLSEEECNAVEEILLYDEEEEVEIRSVEGIAFFPMLRGLTCNYLQIESLDLSQNLNLVGLECMYNPLKSLTLGDNQELVALDCSFCELTSLDVSRNKNLSWLGCAYNKLSSLTLGANSNLAFLDCRYNNLISLDVTQLPHMDRFRCEENKLTSLDLGQNSSLTHLTCDNNNLRSLNLTGTPSLIQLGCFDNELTELDISHCPLIECMVIPECMKAYSYTTHDYYYYTSLYRAESHFTVDKSVRLIRAPLPRYPEPEVSINDTYAVGDRIEFTAFDPAAQQCFSTIYRKGDPYPEYLASMTSLEEHSGDYTDVFTLSYYFDPGEFELWLIMAGEGYMDTIYRYPVTIYDPYLPAPELTLTPDQPRPEQPVLVKLDQTYDTISVQVYTDAGEPVWEEERIFRDTDRFRFSLAEEGWYNLKVQCEKDGQLTKVQQNWGVYVEDSEVPAPDYVLPEGLLRIEDEAFSGIADVVISLPGSVEEISETAFDPSVTILAPAGSDAAEICSGMGLTVIEVE